MKLPTLLAPLLAVSSLAADFPAPEKLPAIAALPDPLVLRDGTRISTKEEWLAKRAPELRALFAHYMFGSVPAKPAHFGAKLFIEDQAALGGAATLREYDVDLGLDTPTRLLVVTPNAARGPAPCFLGLNFHGNHQVLAHPGIALPHSWVRANKDGTGGKTAREEDRGREIELWNVAETIARGYAFATFFQSDIVPDDKELAEPLLRRLAGATTAERGASDTATIMAWAWGISRMLDVLETLTWIDARRVAAVGHSRNGKTALVAVAFDERFALAIPTQAGCGGTAPDRIAPELAALQANGRPKAETVPVINKAFPHWFSGTFKMFNDDPSRLPFDQHELIALCAPRPVLLSNATEDSWGNPPGQFEMLRAAEPVYRLFAKENLGAEKMPAVGKLLDSRLGFYIREGQHSMTTPDWRVWLDYADKWLK